jgi:O-antigen ligase
MKRPRNEPRARDKTSPAERFIWWSLQLGVIAVPLVFSVGHDAYRLPKQLLFEALAIAVFAACAAVSIVDPKRGILQRLHSHRGIVIGALAAVGWTAIATCLSSHRTLSGDTLLWVVCCAAFFLATMALAERRSLWSAAPALAAAVVNTILALLQRFELWTPFNFQEGLTIRARITAYLGNPDDVGAYLLIPILAAAVLAIVTHGGARAVYVAVALLLTGGLIATETLTALIALMAAIATLIVRLSRRAALRIALSVAVVLGIAFILRLPVTARLQTVASQVLAGELHAASSERLEGFHTAWAMFIDHPLFGVGPGCFAYWYLPYDMLLSGSHPEYLISGQNFHDVHNDHLQLLATTGIPGYALFLVALVQFGALSAGASDEPRARFARLFAAPAAVAIGLLTLGSFPLELAAPTQVFLYFAALAAAWGRRA